MLGKIYMAKYPQIQDGEWVEPVNQKAYKMACCNCGLVHVLEFDIVKKRVQFRAHRDNRATAAVRRYMFQSTRPTRGAKKPGGPSERPPG